jgi:hypothetical protein
MKNSRDIFPRNIFYFQCSVSVSISFELDQRIRNPDLRIRIWEVN